MSTTPIPRTGNVCALAFLALLAAGCGEPAQPHLPTPEEVAAYYSYDGGVNVTINGNVAEIAVDQPTAQLSRGGKLWAKVGPYVLLFSKETEQLFTDYPDLAGVRVITRITRGPEVARALLTRNELSGILWKRALNIAGNARLDGTEKPALLDDLVRWGEDHTTFDYNPRYTNR